MIDITMTAVFRPEVLEKTLTSFRHNLFGSFEKYKLVVNIDPVTAGATSQDVLKVIYKFFKEDQVKYNIPKEAHFGKALVWCWNNIESDYVFHLEDDWELINKVDMNDLLNIHKDPRIATARLIIIKGKYMDSYKKDGSLYYTLNNKLSLNPCLIKASYIKGIVPLMDENKNPELQIVHAKTTSKLGQYSAKWNHVILNNKNNPLVKNIGKDWRKEIGLIRAKSDFVTWTQV